MFASCTYSMWYNVVVVSKRDSIFLLVEMTLQKPRRSMAL
jgi:hypothetical protein